MKIEELAYSLFEKQYRTDTNRDIKDWASLLREYPILAEKLLKQAEGMSK